MKYKLLQQGVSRRWAFCRCSGNVNTGRACLPGTVGANTARTASWKAHRPGRVEPGRPHKLGIVPEPEQGFGCQLTSGMWGTTANYTINGLRKVQHTPSTMATLVDRT